MRGGYIGKILRVDLTTGTMAVESLPENKARAYLGGSGLGARILYDETSPATDPLGPENVLIVATGPLTGTSAPTSGRHEIIARSPLTGIYGESDCGGTFGAELKAAGFDAVVVTGAAAEPVYLAIFNGEAKLRPAAHLWGQDTYATDEALRKELDPRGAAISIGPAGEKLALIASIMNDGREGRAAGRAGLGAVMGSKKLKGIVARGTQDVPVFNPEAMKESIRTVASDIMGGTKGFQTNGTANGLVGFEQIGDLPIKNWRQGSWAEPALNISGQRMTETILTRRYFCKSCIIGCGRRVKIDRGLSAGMEIGGPEYETLAALGAMCLIDDLQAVAEANDLCNRLGLDTISTGATIAFAMECYERGLISQKDTDGVELTWGNAEAMLEMVRRMGQREGFGRLLSEGSRRAAEAIGGDAPRYAIHTKGLELPMHDPRAYNSAAVGYATSNRGACHLQALSHAFEGRIGFPEFGYPGPLDRFASEGKGVMVARMQHVMCLLDSLKLCKFTLFGKLSIANMVDWLNWTTGWDTTFDELVTTGERIFNLKRVYNVRLGVDRAADTVPQRILTEERGEGGAAHNLPPLDSMLDEYYRYRGWDENGRPTPQKLAELGLA